MKALVSVLVLIVSLPAFANQTVNCRQVNKAGKVLAKGGKVKLDLALTNSGTVNEKASKVKVTGFTRKGSESYLDDLKLRSTNESAPSEKSSYTTYFFDSLGVGMGSLLDIQLQFQDARTVNQNFKNVRANFVIGSDDANPETGFAFGYDVSCNSTVN